MDDSYRQRFLRNIGIMDEKGLEKIRSSRVAIGGLGMGGSVFINLVRTGFERFHVADPDVYERTNINRQRAAKESTVSERKDDALTAEARDINPSVEITCFREGVSPANVADFLSGVDFVIDVVDIFAVDAKLALNAEAARLGIPLISCASVGFGATYVFFKPGAPTFAELSGMSTDLSHAENVGRFVQFITPEIPVYMADQLSKAMKGESHIPFLASGIEITAGFVTSEVVKYVLGIGKHVTAPNGVYIDPVELRLRHFTASYRERSLPSITKKAA